jgi:hypothetical protein
MSKMKIEKMRGFSWVTFSLFFFFFFSFFLLHFSFFLPMNSAIEQGKAALRTANAQLGARLDPVSLVLLGSGLTIAVAGARAALDPDSGFKSWLFRAFLRLAKATPGAGAAIEREQEKTVQSLRKMLRIEGDNNRHLVIPPVGIERWVTGFVFGGFFI